MYHDNILTDVKIVAAKNLRKARMKKMQNQIGQPRPLAVDEIKIFDNVINSSRP